MDSIPKIIHYCWFGKGKKPTMANKSIKSWRKQLPGYQIIEWNESNFDVNSNTYVKQAYAAGKFAFVSDYVRLLALYNHGGIYLDTDVQVLKDFDSLLEKPVFVSFENDILVSTAVIGSTKGHSWIARMLNYYMDRAFVKDDGTLDTTANPDIVTEIAVKEYGLNLGNTMQVLTNEVHVYPSDYFSPKEYRTGEIQLTDNTYTIHHYDGSWLPATERYRKKIVWLIRRVLKSFLGNKIYRIFSNLVDKCLYKLFKLIEMKPPSKWDVLLAISFLTAIVLVILLNRNAARF